MNHELYNGIYELKNRVKKNRRLTVGYLDENAYMEHAGYIAAGVYEAAGKNDMNVIRFGHYDVHDKKPEPFIVHVLQHILQYDLDGLLFLGWARAAQHDDFRRMFDGMPLYCVGSDFPDVPHSYFPGDLYVRELLLHLLDHHGYRKIAFIEPLHNDDRAGVYKAVMEERGIFDPSLLIEHKLFRDVSFGMRGKEAVSILLDERKVKPDAIMSMYSIETKGLIEELRNRGLSVPGDIAVTSYEESDIARYSSPPVTTIYFPYREIGYTSCEKMASLLKNGYTSFAARVDGRIIYRDTCGCLSENVHGASAGEIRSAGMPFDEIGRNDLDRIISELGKEMTGIDVSALAAAFYQSFRHRNEKNSEEAGVFLDVFEQMLDDFGENGDIFGQEMIVPKLRKALLPYFIPYLSSDVSAFLWAENIFQQAQVLCLDKQESIWSGNATRFVMEHNDLQKAGYRLVDNYNTDSLMRSLEESLTILGIPSCYVFVFNKSADTDNLFESCSLLFEYTGGKRKRSRRSSPGPAKKQLSRLLFKEDRPYRMVAELLYVEEEPIGFVIFEKGPDDERIYSALAINLSTALRGVSLLSKLDTGYKQLVEQAHRKGMADIASGVLHNVANILNSINTSVQLITDLVKNSPVNDFVSANEILESHLDNIEEFILNNDRGKKLMQFYTKLKEPVTDYRRQLMALIERLLKSIYAVEDIIAAQSSLTGNGRDLDKLDIVTLIEDALLMNSVLIQKGNIRVVRNYGKNLSKSLVRKTRLLEVLVNIIGNATESMMDMPEGNRVLTIEVDQDDRYLFIRIRDTGRGIPGELLDRIFDYGFTTKEDGHGFGLHTCAVYISQMGGKLWAESSGAGEGATFVIRLRC